MRTKKELILPFVSFVSRFTFVYPVVETSDANVGVPDVVVDTIITENGMGWLSW